MSRNHYYVPTYSLTILPDGTRKEDWRVVDTFDHSEAGGVFATHTEARAKADELNGDAFMEAQKAGAVTGFAAHR